MKPVLSLLFKLGKKKQTLEKAVESIQKGNKDLQNELIQQYKPFIAKTVSSVCKRYIDEKDDEFSIGLIAFNEAIEKYSPEKGNSLLAFAELIIKRKVIDYIRKEARSAQNINIDLQEGDDQESSQSLIEAELSIDEYRRQIEQEQRREEILYFQKQLKDYGLSFKELLENSPKHTDARQNAIKVAMTLVEHEELAAILYTKKQLPVKQLEQLVSVSRKTIERNRKYIIAMCIIITGDYIYLKDYLKGCCTHEKRIIVEKNKKFVTLLTPDGQFLKAKNDRHSYEIGEEIMLPSETRMGRRASFFDFFKLRPFKMGIFTMTAIMLFIFIVLPVFSNNKAYAYMTIDINPSVEMALNSDYEVIELTPLNDEGQKVVNDIDDWEKTDFKKVIDDIITDCSEHGYVKKSKEILISTVYENTEDNTYKKAVKKQLNDVTEKYKTTYRMESLESDMQTREKAKKEGVSTGSYIKSNEKNDNKDIKDDSSKPSGEEDQKSDENEDENTDQTDTQDSKQGDNEQLNDADSGDQKEEKADDQIDDSDKDKKIKESDENTNTEKDGTMSKPQYKILKIKEMKITALTRAKANITGTGTMVNKARTVLRPEGITLQTDVIQTATAVIIIQLKMKIRRVPPANKDLNLFSCAI